jgi:hypothetical protein
MVDSRSGWGAMLLVNVCSLVLGGHGEWATVLVSAKSDRRPQNFIHNCALEIEGPEDLLVFDTMFSFQLEDAGQLCARKIRQVHMIGLASPYHAEAL